MTSSVLPAYALTLGGGVDRSTLLAIDVQLGAAPLLDDLSSPASAALVSPPPATPSVLRLDGGDGAERRLHGA